MPASAQLVLASFFAGTGWILSLKALEGMPPLLFMGSRFLIAGLVIGATLSRADRALLPQILRRSVPAGAVLAASMVFWTLGLSRTDGPGVASFITASGNLVVPVIGAVLFGWAFHRRTGVALLIALAGLALLLVGPGARPDPSHPFFIAAAGLWALNIALTKRTLDGFRVRLTTSALLVLSGGFILAASLVFEGLPGAVPGAETMIWFVASLLLSTILRFLFQFAGQQKTTTARAGLFMSFEPVWALGLSALFLAERPVPIQALGCALVLAAVILENRRGRRG